MNGLITFLLASGTSLLAGYFTAAFAFKKFFKSSNVTYLQLAGFLGLFLVTCVGLMFFIGWALPPERVAFGR